MRGFRPVRAIGHRTVALVAAMLAFGSVGASAPSASASASAHTTVAIHSAALADGISEGWMYQPSCSGSYPVVIGNATGWFPCSTKVLWVQWSPMGHYEYFGIGTDWHVWHVVDGWSSWVSMGGTASSINEAITYYGYPTIEVHNKWATVQNWCSSWYGSSWSGWKACMN